MTRTGMIEALVDWGLRRCPLVRVEDERLPLHEREDAFERATRRIPLPPAPVSVPGPSSVPAATSRD